MCACTFTQKYFKAKKLTAATNLNIYFYFVAYLFFIHFTLQPQFSLQPLPPPSPTPLSTLQKGYGLPLGVN